ncbi:hypothetical protein NBRC116188_19410 [Oceaniserpentilla sp. 4NH20-0058]|uniref:CBS domain-containing protein n=1 Tax=Oceaniserpentilla sp. 4NH20-0058 TaxID=3127660 RepID=UPI00310C59E8
MPFIFIDQGSPSIRDYATPKSKGTSPLTPSNPTRAVQGRSQTGQKAYQQNTQSKPMSRQVHRAGEIMSTPAISLDIQQVNLEHARQTLIKHNIKHLPITENGTLNAILSECDILKALAFKQENQEWITKKVFAATVATDIHQLAHVMFDEHIGCLPIINEQHELVGMVTRSDILKITSQYGPMEFWA